MKWLFWLKNRVYITLASTLCWKPNPFGSMYYCIITIHTCQEYEKLGRWIGKVIKSPRDALEYETKGQNIVYLCTIG